MSISFAVFALFCIFSLHTPDTRRFVYFVPFGCISAAYLVQEIGNKINKRIVPVFIIIFIAFSIPHSIDIITHTFKLAPISQWLKENGIAKNAIATCFPLEEKGDTVNAIPILGRVIFSTGKFIIHWPFMKRVYEYNRIRYLFVAGISSKYVDRREEPVLQRFSPLKTWPHPHYYKDPDHKLADFAIYDLKDIFGPL
jgi:hypothetical protein